jgi:AcrR family transcriptional regulator
VKKIEKKTDLNRNQKTEQIFRQALKVFAKYGYKKTTLDDIASELDMTKSNLYLYAADKRNLYEKAVAFGLRKWQKTAADAIAGESDPVQRLKKLAITGLNFLSNDQEMRNIIINDPSVFPLFPNEDHFYKINVDSMDIMKGILRDGIKKKVFRKVDLENAAPFLYSLYVLFVIRFHVKSERMTLEKQMETAFDIIFNGLVENQ